MKVPRAGVPVWADTDFFFNPCPDDDFKNTNKIDQPLVISSNNKIKKVKIHSNRNKKWT